MCEHEQSCCGFQLCDSKFVKSLWGEATTGTDSCIQTFYVLAHDKHFFLYFKINQTASYLANLCCTDFDSYNLLTLL